jgi:Ohr subfamily peroxiredoxin
MRRGVFEVDPVTPLSQTRVTAAGGRNGTIRSDDDALQLPYAPPARLGGESGRTNSDQLFAAGYAMCFSAAVIQVAHAQTLRVRDSDIEVIAQVDVSPDGRGSFRFSVTLEVTIAGLDLATANAVVAAAHKVCPYSNAIKGNIDVWFLVAVR